MTTTRTIAYNPTTRKWEVVYPEDEIAAHRIITQFWSASLEKWITVPETDRE